MLVKYSEDEKRPTSHWMDYLRHLCCLSYIMATQTISETCWVGYNILFGLLTYIAGWHSNRKSEFHHCVWSSISTSCPLVKTCCTTMLLKLCTINERLLYLTVLWLFSLSSAYDVIFFSKWKPAVNAVDETEYNKCIGSSESLFAFWQAAQLLGTQDPCSHEKQRLKGQNDGHVFSVKPFTDFVFAFGSRGRCCVESLFATGTGSRAR